MGKNQEELEVCVQFRGYHVIETIEAWSGSSHTRTTAKDECGLFRKDKRARRGSCLLCERAREGKCVELCLGLDDELAESF